MSFTGFSYQLGTDPIASEDVTYSSASQTSDENFDPCCSQVTIADYGGDRLARSLRVETDFCATI